MPAKKSKKSKKKGKTVSVNFAGVEGRNLLPEEDYLVTVDSVVTGEGEAGEYLEWKFKTFDEEDEKLNDVTITYVTSLAPQSLWNLKALLEALEVDIPDNEFNLNLVEMEGEEVVVTVVHEEYNKRQTMKVADFYSKSQIPEDAPEENVEVKDDTDKKSKKSKKKEKEEDDKYPSGDIEDLSKKELQEIVDEHDLDVNLETLRTNRKRIAAVIEALDDKGLISD